MWGNTRYRPPLDPDKLLGWGEPTRFRARKLLFSLTGDSVSVISRNLLSFLTNNFHGGKFQVTFYLQKNLHQRLIRMDHHNNPPQIHCNLFPKPKKQQKNLNQPIFHLDNFYSRLMSGKKVKFRKIDFVLTIFLAFTAQFFLFLALYTYTLSFLLNLKFEWF